MADPTDEQLRESARHRGLKLLKSRRRKPGGDFGLYGLAAADGEPRFGVGESGVTATASEIADFLRKGDAATWAISVEKTPAPEAKAPRRMAPHPQAEPEPEPAIRPRRTRRSAPPTPATEDEKAPELPKSVPSPPARRPAKESTSSPPATPKAELVIRPATRADAAAVAALISGIDAALVAERIAAATAIGEAVLAADKGGVIGCLAWHVVPTLQHGPIGRITYLAVMPGQRRRGVGRNLVEALAAIALTRDLPLVEVVSDLTIESAHGFFRRLGFTQTSYRFTRQPGGEPPASV